MREFEFEIQFNITDYCSNLHASNQKNKKKNSEGRSKSKIHWWFALPTD